MGDRANIYIHEGSEPGVYLYTHWAGTELPETVRAGLERGVSRWEDVEYLARILFDQMTGGTLGETGYGISAVLGDGGDRIVDVDTETGQVTLAPGEPVSFRAYVASRPTWPRS